MSKFIVIAPSPDCMYFKNYQKGTTNDRDKAHVYTTEDIDRCCVMFAVLKTEQKGIWGDFWLDGCKLRVVG